MKPTSLLLAATVLMSTTITSALAASAAPPDVAKKPHVVKAPHGAERNDEYYWLRDDKRENKEMLAYLNAENAYTDAHGKTVHTAPAAKDIATDEFLK